MSSPVSKTQKPETGAAVPPVPASRLEPSTAQALSTLCLEYRRLGAKIDTLKAQQEGLKTDIEELALALPHKSVEGQGWRTTRSQKTSTSLDTVLVSEESTRRDIDPVDVLEIIKFATVEHKGKEYIVITDPSKERKKKTKDRDSDSNPHSIFD